MVKSSALLSLIPILSLQGLSQTSEPAGTPGKVSRELWWNMSNAIDLEYAWKQEAFYQTANIKDEISSLETPQSIGEKYAQRLRGYITAPVTGEYRFWGSGDNGFALWLGDGESKFSTQKLIHINGSTLYREWGRSRKQASAGVLLEAGKRYYIEAQHKEGSGGDHMSVSWSYAGGSGLKNWARESGAVASQSSVGWGGVASRAIDGNTSGRYSDNSITHTLNEAGSWWQVDLGQDRLIDRVELFNRDLDVLVIKRLSNFRVSILDSAGGVVISKDFHTSGTHVLANDFWETGGVQGRIVKVELLGPGASAEQFLSLAEVEVLGRSSSTESYQARELVPSSVLESYAGSLNDQDDDGYPDDWENQHGFSTSGYQGGNFAPLADPDKDGISNIEESRRGLDPFSPSSIPGYLTMERWTGIAEYDVSGLRRADEFFADAQEIKTVATTQFTDISEYSGARLRGYITAPVSGNYRFWVSARNGGELWLSEDATKYRKKRIGQMGPNIGTGHGITFTNSNLWDQFSSQMSKEIYLEAGQKYYMEMLTQQGHGGGYHVSAAWAVPGQAREVLPLSVISSYGGEVEDSDDDYLPDAWETQYGLSITDNGGLNRSQEGENGDFDMDGLNNRAEYLAGTNPTNPDSDGDGIIDGDEVKSYGTDPAVSDAPSETLVNNVDLSGYTNSTATWSMTGQGLVSSSFRGGVEWGFNVPTTGHWSLRIDTKLLGDLYLNESIPATVSIDGKKVWSGNIVYGQNRSALLRVITPHLSAGSHTVELFIDNMTARRSVSIQSIGVYKPEGLDADSDGTPDWVRSLLSGENTIATYQSSSRISPAFIEGKARISSDVTINGANATAGLDHNHWYGNLVLDANQATPFNVNFEQGISEAGTITWQSTNIFDNETLTIRRGDSLKLVAQPGGASTGQSVSLNFGDTNWARVPGVTASQSVESYGGAASRAIDGNTNGAWTGGSLTHTNNAVGSWWQVDLGQMRTIDRVKLWNRTDGVPQRLSNYRISIIDAAGNTVVYQDFHTATGHSGVTETWTLNNPVQGKIVKVELLGKNREGTYYLSLAECKVFAPNIVNLASDAEFSKHTFAQAGMRTVTATHSNGSTAQLTLNVKQAEFSATEQDLVSNSLGNVRLNANLVDSDLYFDGGNSADVLSNSQSGGNLYLRVAPKSFGSVKIAARLSKNGPILATQKVNLIGISDALQNDLTTGFLSSDFQGYYALNAPLVATNLPTGGKVKVTIFRAGVTFPDGTKVKWIETSDITNGVVNLEFLFPIGMAGGYCHYLDIYDRNGAYLGRR